MKKIVLTLIAAYQKSGFFRNSFFKFFYLSDSVCRFQPTCAQYTYDSVLKYGTLKGLALSFRRIIRCHPFNPGGFDPVP